MLGENFDTLLTFDKNMEHQQTFTMYPIAVFVLTGSINTFDEMRKLVPKIETFLATPPLPSGIIEIK